MMNLLENLVFVDFEDLVRIQISEMGKGRFEVDKIEGTYQRTAVNFQRARMADAENRSQVD